MFYVVYDEFTIVVTEDLDILTEYLASGMRLYGYADDENGKDLLLFECSQISA